MAKIRIGTTISSWRAPFSGACPGVLPLLAAKDNVYVLDLAAQCICKEFPESGITVNDTECFVRRVCDRSNS